MGLQNVRNAKSYGAPPAAVTSPVSGTSLLSVWNLQAGGTGSTGPYTNGTLMPATPVENSTTNMPPYLRDTGLAKWGNNYGTTGPTLFFNIGASTVSVSNYDFSNSPYMLINGTGTITFTNCLFSRLGTNGTQTAISGPSDINGNITLTYGSTLTINFVNCTFLNSAFYGGSGNWNFSYCKFQDMKQGAGDTFQANLSYNWCYFPGIGVSPFRDGHVELTQFNGNSPATLSVTNCMIDLSANGQARTPFPGGTTGWTAIFAFNGATPATVLIDSNIMIGLTAINANPLWLNSTPYCLTLTAGAWNTVTNNIMQSGSVGYLTGKASGTFSGNRTYTNIALTSADFS